jgi:hypothetical protein
MIWLHTVGLLNSPWSYPKMFVFEKFWKSYGKFWDLGLRQRSPSDKQWVYFLAPSSWPNMGMQSMKFEYVVPDMAL